MTKKLFSKIIVTFLVLALGLGLSGCSNQSKNNAASKTTLYWWSSNEDATQEVLEEMVKGFTQQNSSIEVKVVLKDPRTYEQEATDALASYKTVEEAPDILAVRAEDLPRYATKLTTAPDDLFDLNLAAKKKTGVKAPDGVLKQFEDAVGKNVIFNDSSGKQIVYGLPIALDSLAIYKNTALFSQAIERLTASNRADKSLSQEQVNQIKKMLTGPIDTWEKLAAIVPYLKVTNGESVSTAALAMGTSLNVERSYDILQTIMMQNGTQLTSEDLNSAAFNQNEIGSTAPTYPGEDALKFYLRFSNPSDALYTWNEKMPNSYDAFKNGQLALMFHYASAYRFLKEQAPNLKSSIEVAPMPQIKEPKLVSDKSALKTMANMWVETAPSAKADAKRQRAAWAFIQYITSKSGSRPYLSAMKLPSALREGTSSSKFQAFNDQKSYADSWYKGTRAQDVDKLFIGSIDDAYKGRKTPKAALDELATQVTTVLQASNAKWATGVKSGS